MRARRFAVVGGLLGVGAPAGWWLLRAALGRLARGGPIAELRENALLYGYLLGGSTAAFAIFGARLGKLADALAAADAVHAREAITDPLTSLPNPRYFWRRLAEEIARAERNGGPLALVMLDLDEFKRFNDRFGHIAGDRALVAVGEVLRTNCRQSDVPCRVGGEEFAVICPGDAAAAESLAERIRGALAARTVQLDGAAARITGSFGVAQWRGLPAERLFVEADAALYEAKRRGRNRVARAEALTPEAR